MNTKVIVCGLAVLSMGAAQDFPQFSQWMKGCDQATAALRKMDKKVGPQAVRAAEVAGGIFEELIGFFRQRGGQDAIRWAEEGKSAAAMLAAAAYREDAAAAAAAFKVVSGACTSCHNVYRERGADGKYRFKQPKP